MKPLLIAQLLVCAFFGVLFLQSGIDKVTDHKGNLEWLTGHFAKTPFRSVVPLLLGFITAIELAAGAMSLVGVYFVWRDAGGPGVPSNIPVIGLALAGLALLMLFTGQRMAKDYVGAVSLATYMGVDLIGLYLLSLR